MTHRADRYAVGQVPDGVFLFQVQGVQFRRQAPNSPWRK